MHLRLPRFPKRLCATALLGVTLLAACGPSSNQPARVTIPLGASFHTAADSLARSGVIHFPLFFRMYARIQGHDRNIRPGTYLMKPGMPWSSIIVSLNEGRGIINRITIPEGFTIAQITPLLVKQLNIPAESINAAVRDSATRARLGVPAATLEGYLFPDTYVFPPGTTARKAVSEMVKRFEREWTPEDSASLTRLNITRNAAITMASIVEKEAKIPEERPVIAGVYYNRLRLDMPLQADPTVQYALGQHVERVTFKDLQVASPYNTYLNPGLPPGPIASPGHASIQAALNPANVPYLYFVAAADGHHEFRTTLAEHTAAIRTVRESVKTKSPKKHVSK